MESLSGCRSTGGNARFDATRAAAEGQGLPRDWTIEPPTSFEDVPEWIVASAPAPGCGPAKMSTIPFKARRTDAWTDYRVAHKEIFDNGVRARPVIRKPVWLATGKRAQTGFPRQAVSSRWAGCLDSLDQSTMLVGEPLATAGAEMIWSLECATSH